MDVIVRGKNVDVTAALRDYVTRKVGKLARYLDAQPLTAEAVLSVQKDRQTVEVTIPLEGRLLRGEESTADMYASVDLVVDKLESQIHRIKSELKRRVHGTREEPGNGPVAVQAIVRKKTFSAKPMSVDEALLQMEMLGHDFFVFTNDETEQVNVVYRRRDGNFGLLEPQA
ncbi:MAG: ribosome-associated translation inhibitor RaiA [Actinomycetia bacterium]|nr:ribosome-associated translation inhibitor RaiA [Actinomycetes bacterium]